MRIWIDVANSPHPLLFAPLVRRFEAAGHDVVLTARDHAQTLELARMEWGDRVVAVGEATAGARASKAKALARRVGALRRWARREQPDLALSHNSYTQIVAAALLRIRIVTAMDYEYQPLNHLAFRLADTVFLPEALPTEAVRNQGAMPRKVRHYPGFKEELYLGDFTPTDVLSKLNLERNGRRAIAVVRTPASGAAYDRSHGDSIEQILRALSRSGAAVVVLARHPEHRRHVDGLRLPEVIVPPAAIDARSLIYAADLVVGTGGTMTREAALMEVPALSAFAGKPGAVDLALERRGMLGRLGSVHELESVPLRESEPRPLDELRRRSDELSDSFVAAVLAVADARTALSGA